MDTVEFVGYRHNREDILAGAIAFVREEGLLALSFGRLAKFVGIADRTIVYYFPTKDELIADVLASLAASLQTLLESALGEERLTMAAAVARTWAAMTTKDADAVFAIYVQAIGAAAGGVAPYYEAVPLIFAGWIDWMTPRMAAPTLAQRRSAATGAVAQIDGLLLVRHIGGAALGRQAARALGVTT